MSYIRTADPTLEPISVQEAKAQARIEDHASDALIRSYIVAAREEAEQELGYGLFTQTWRYDLHEFHDVIPLPMALKLQSITSVKYYDADGTLQTLSSSYYETDTASRPARLVRAADYSWPSLQADRHVPRVQITYVVGWSSVADIPEKIKQGLRMWVTYLDANRDGMEIQAQQAERAARGCWSDKLYHIPCE